MNKKEVIKHSAAVQIANRINLLQRKAWNVLLSNAYNDLFLKETYQINIKQLCDKLAYDSQNQQYLKNTLKALVSCVVEWNILDKEGKHEWGVSSMLADAIIKNGIVNYSYGASLRERLYNPAMYARISLSMQNKFNSKHALALYELFVDYFIAKRGYGETPFITIQAFRELMGLRNTEYIDFKYLRKRLIKEPLIEINEKSDLFITVEYKRERRKVVAIRFHIKLNPKKENLLSSILYSKKPKQLPPLKEQNPEPEILNQELCNRLQVYFGLSEKQSKEILKNYAEDYISENLKVVEEKHKGGKVQNIAPYTLKALKEDFRPQKIEPDEKTKEVQKRFDNGEIINSKEIGCLTENQRKNLVFAYVKKNTVALMNKEAAKKKKLRYVKA